MGERVAHPVNAAALMRGIKHPARGRAPVIVVVSDDQLDATQTAIGERAQEVGPERLGLDGPVATPNTSRLPSSFTATAIITARLTILPPSRTFR